MVWTARPQGSTLDIRATRALARARHESGLMWITARMMEDECGDKALQMPVGTVDHNIFQVWQKPIARCQSGGRVQTPTI